MFVKERVTPLRLFIGEIQRANVRSLHGFWSVNSGGGKDRRSQIDIKCKVIIGLTVAARRHSRVINDQWDADTFLMGIPFVG